VTGQAVPFYLQTKTREFASLADFKYHFFFKQNNWMAITHYVICLPLK